MLYGAKPTAWNRIELMLNAKTTEITFEDLNTETKLNVLGAAILEITATLSRIEEGQAEVIEKLQNLNLYEDPFKEV